MKDERARRIDVGDPGRDGIWRGWSIDGCKLRESQVAGRRLREKKSSGEFALGGWTALGLGAELEKWR